MRVFSPRHTGIHPPAGRKEAREGYALDITLEKGDGADAIRNYVKETLAETITTTPFSLAITTMKGERLNVLIDSDFELGTFLTALELGAQLGKGKNE